MITISVAELCKATNGSLINNCSTQANEQHVMISSVSTDTRTMPKGALFIALKGPSFDAHDLLPEAIKKGAVVLLVNSDRTIKLAEQPWVVEVENTRVALGLLAGYIRQKVEGLKCAAITGSNGKTTCKELLSSILTVQCGDQDYVLSTAGNFNNDIGLPLTLLRLQTQHQFAVVELGANHIGEIAYTSTIAKPDVALVNNVMPAHLEGFGSLEGVATAKAEIWSSLSSSGIAVVNLSANFSDQFIQTLHNNKQPILTFSNENKVLLSRKPDLYASDVHYNQLGQSCFTLNVEPSAFSVIYLANKLQPINTCAESVTIQLNLPGKHNVNNALAASAMALALGCSLKSIQQGINTLQQVPGRVNSSLISNDITVIDDTYNANSASVNAAIDLLSQYDSEKLLILGDMGELGQYAEQEHQKIGLYAQKQEVDQLFTVGNLSQLTTNAYNAASKKMIAEHFFDKEGLELAISHYLSNKKSKLVILVKGSRSAKMEEIVTFIKTKFSK